MNGIVQAKTEPRPFVSMVPMIRARQYVLKKVIDMVGAAAALMALAPCMLVIVCAIRLESRGPSLVHLDRISEGRKIRVYKFRSMVNGAHAMKKYLLHLNERSDGPFFKIKNDPRITKVGRVLRKFRFDELPQFINVLKGELSLVGPRPHEPEEVMQYPEEYHHVIFAKAGVTGLSQVSGASSLPYHKELELDSYYVRNASLWLDLKILAKTAKIMFSDPTAV